MRRLLTLVFLAMALVAQEAQAADRLPLHRGSSGPRVAALQWLLSGHRPNVFTRVHGTYKWDPKQRHGYFGEATAKAVVAYKYRLGWPVPEWRQATAGKEFFSLVLGRKHWPPAYVRRATARVKAGAATNDCGRRIARVARAEIGVTESPYGSNRGPRISYPLGGVPSYQSTTGAYGAAWCVSYAQWVMIRAGIGSFADRSAGVFYTVGWASRRGYLHAKPKVGAIVAFTNGQGHMGVVVKVGAGWFVSVEGNSANRVRERFWRIGQRPAVFVWLPFPKNCR